MRNLCVSRFPISATCIATTAFPETDCCSRWLRNVFACCGQLSHHASSRCSQTSLDRVGYGAGKQKSTHRSHPATIWFGGFLERSPPM